MGRALRRHLPDARFASREQLDVRDATALDEALRNVSSVIHLAALTQVDACEADPLTAHEVNASATSELVAKATDHGARVVFTSTDYVFDGTKQDCYDETDTPVPLNEYGKSKLKGERAVLHSSSGAVLRTSWVYGDGRNFIRSILRAAKTRDEVTVVDDQIGRPTSASSVAAALAQIVERPVTGLVHYSAEGQPVSWAGVARRVVARAGLGTRVVPVDSDEYAQRAGHLVAPRPKNSVLCLVRAAQLNLPQEEWGGSVDAYVDGLS